MEFGSALVDRGPRKEFSFDYRDSPINEPHPAVTQVTSPGTAPARAPHTGASNGAIRRRRVFAAEMAEQEKG